jgi:molecular chaperone GrpE
MNNDNNKKETSDPENEKEDEITQTTPKEVLEELDQNAEKLRELEEKYLRTYADFENYRKRVAKEKEEVRQSTSELLLRELLEVKDHLELALSHSREAPVSPELKTLREGVDLTLKQMQNFLKKFDVEEVKALGDPFNPALHEAIHQEASREYAPGSVIHVYQKGYVRNGRLLRAARVTVASDASKETSSSHTLSSKEKT